MAPLCLQAVRAQSSGSQRNNRSNSSSASTPNSFGNPAETVAPRTISGVVVNGLTGAPVARALVNGSGRVALTDAQGKFNFPEFTATTAYLLVTKPGYSASQVPDYQPQQIIKDLDSLIVLKLYPNALLTGKVTGPDGLPLSRVQVQLSRLSFDNTGSRWYPSGSSQTDAHGDYRFDVSAGRYRVTTSYLERSTERGEAVLPALFPANTSSNFEAFQIGSGEQRQIDLRPRVSPVYPVSINLEGGEIRNGARLVASTGAGTSFQLPSQRSGEGATTQLPAGTFLLRANGGDREDPIAGEARVTVTAHGSNQVVIQLAPEPTFPVESSFEVEPASTSNSITTTPSLQQFNLYLRSLAGTPAENYFQDVRLVVHPDHSASFQAPPGRYRLGGNNTGTWYVRSATNGVTDLLTEDLVIAQGAAGSPIRVILSNASSRLKGTVKTAGVPATGWVYLIAEQPSLTPYAEVYLQTDGSFSWVLPPGKYLAVPSAHTVRDDFRSSVFLREFAAGAREVEMTAGSDASVDLTLAPEGVAR